METNPGACHRVRAGNANVTADAPAEAVHLPPPEVERQMIYTLNPLLWREGSEVKTAPAFAMVGLPASTSFGCVR